MGDQAIKRSAKKKRRFFKFLIGVRRLPNEVWLAIFLLAILSCFMPDSGLALAGVATLAVCCQLLWRPGEPQILLFLVTYHWLQAVGGLIYAAWQGKSIALALGDRQLELATLLSLVGILVLALGINLTKPKKRTISLIQLYAGILAINRKRIFMAWVVLTIGALLLDVMGRIVPGLSQAFIALVVWKWAAALLLFLRSFLSDRGRGQVVIVVMVESSMGMMNYFSAFKFVFFILILAATGVIALKREKMVPLIGIGALTFFLMLVWQGIKNEYRMFLSQGERAQVTKVSVFERIDWLNNALFELDTESFNDGMASGLARLGYVEYFGDTIKHIPRVRPHTDGKLWKEAVLNPLMPRLLFPNKPVYNDSERTNTYTGNRVAGVADGASISIGYMAESYIDFGRWGMFVPILILGLLIGGAFRWLRNKAPHPIMGLSLASCLLLSSSLLLESSNVKITGSFASGFIVTALILKFYGKVIWKWLVAKKARAI